MNPRIPEMNENSKLLCSQIQRKPLYESKKKDGDLGAAPKPQDDPEVMQRKKAKVEQFLNRNYEKEVKRKIMIEEKQKQA